MFERAEVRRGGRAVSFALAALAHGLLLLAVLLLLRKHIEAEPPVIIVDPPRWREPAKKPVGKGDSSRDRTREKRHRPPPRPVDKDVAPPPAPEPEVKDEPDSPPPESASETEGSGEGSVGPASPDSIGGDCVGPDCSATATHRAPDEIFEVQPGIVRPRALCDPPRPMMPEQARLMGITGAVLMRYVVETDGSVSRMQLRNSDAPPVLVEAVQRWLEHCRFAPGMARGQMARIQVDQPFLFKLH